MNTSLGSILLENNALAHPLTRGILGSVTALLVLAPVILQILRRTSSVTEAHFAEMWLRWKSWLWLSALIVLPILLRAEFVAMAVGALALLCHREFSISTGLREERAIYAAVAVAIVALTCGTIISEHLFVSCSITGFVLILFASVPSDRPAGFLRRVGLGTISFLLFGVCLGHLGLLARETDYRPLLLLLLLAIELNDVMAYCSGKLFGRAPLLVRTSKGKTMAGFLGAMLFTAALFTAAGTFLFNDLGWGRLLSLGLVISVLGHFGDLVVSSIKRDLGIKDLGTAIPGHGGILDRFDSLLLAPPVLYHLLTWLRAPVTGL